jgi:hypothetical protein
MVFRIFSGGRRPRLISGAKCFGDEHVTCGTFGAATVRDCEKIQASILDQNLPRKWLHQMP